MPAIVIEARVRWCLTCRRSYRHLVALMGSGAFATATRPSRFVCFVRARMRAVVEPTGDASGFIPEDARDLYLWR